MSYEGLSVLDYNHQLAPPGNPSSAHEGKSATNGDRMTVKPYLTFLIAAIAFVLFILIVKIIVSTRRRHGIKPMAPPRTANPSCTGLYKFSMLEIEEAMKLNTRKKLLGVGRDGEVYKGILPSGQEVAIKEISPSEMSYSSFTRELECLSRIRHPSVVCLLGYCNDDRQYLVYDYCRAGNLAQYLQRKDAALPWGKRVKILRDCALALRFLHGYSDGCLVHGDIKLKSILLTGGLEARLSGFGLAHLMLKNASDERYMAKDTMGFASYDIHNFGFLALQLLSGQIIVAADQREQLIAKAQLVYSGKHPLEEFVDPRMDLNLNMEDFKSILEVASLCCSKSHGNYVSIEIVCEEMDRVLRHTEDKSYSMKIFQIE